jgi:CDP-glycerol glycerophosphotransferase
VTHPLVVTHPIVTARRLWRRSVWPRFRRATKRMPPGVQALLRRAKRLVDTLRERRRDPLVSIIVPFYNVEAYLAECLQSVVDQNYRRLQIILVDDGGTDGSYGIAQRFADSDRRIRILRRPNAGLGGARNAGLRRAHGAYLRFVDSYDILPLDSVTTMVRTIRQTGSDFVVGNYRRLSLGRRTVLDWTREVHRSDRFGLNVSDLPEILRDVLATNKLFNTNFFRKTVKQFPEGIRYEDQEPTTKAYLVGRFDVLRAVVYDWRLREEGTSISQQKADLRDWLTVQQRVSRIIAASADQKIHRYWLAEAAGVDLRPYYKSVARTDLAFWEQLRDGVLQLVSQFDLATWQQVPIGERLLTLAVVDDLRDDLITLIVRREECGARLPGIVRDGSAWLHSTYLGGLTLCPDPDLLRFADVDLVLRSRLERAEWDGDRLTLGGFAYLSGVDLATARSRIALELVSRQNKTRVPLKVTRGADPWIDIDSGDSYNSYQNSGFAAVIDLKTLADVPGGASHQPWSLHLCVEVDGVMREAPLREVDNRGELGDLPVGPVGPHGRWVFVPDDVRGLGVRFQPSPETTVEDLAITDRDVVIVTGGRCPESVQVRCAATDRTLNLTPQTAGSGRATFRFQLPESGAGGEHPLSWSLRCVLGKRRHPLFWPEGSAVLHDRFPAWLAIRPTCAPDGALRLRQGTWAAALTMSTWLRLSLQHPSVWWSEAI